MRVIRRPGWTNVADLQAAAVKSGRIGNEEMADRVRWISRALVAFSDVAPATHRYEACMMRTRIAKRTGKIRQE